MIDSDVLHARLSAIQAQIAQGRLVYADLELRRDETIARIVALGRQLDSLNGAKQEIDALLAILETTNGASFEAAPS